MFGSNHRSGPDSDGPYVCRVCGRVLDYDSGVQRYLHTTGDADADHAPEPVRQTEAEVVVGRCDFCYVDHPEWVIPARDFEVVPGHVSNGNWAACDECGVLIERGQWSALTRRARSGWEARHGEMPANLAASLPRLYRLLRRNITGSKQPNPALRASGGDTARYGQGRKSEPHLDG